MRFTFPRQAEREGLCLSDYFLPADTSALRCCWHSRSSPSARTSTRCARRWTRAASTRSRCSCTGSVSPRPKGWPSGTTGSIREELGLDRERGKRYSFGYSACPDLADQAKLFKLLNPEDGIGVTLTSAYQLVPEASTSAIIVHHPEAVYYMVKA